MTDLARESVWLALLGAICSLVACSSVDDESYGRVEHAVLGGKPSPASQDSVVGLTLPGNSGCTAEVVAPRLVITARHCLFSFAGDKPPYLRCGVGSAGSPVSQALDPADITVWRNHEKPLESIARGKRIYGGPALDLCENDIALIELDEAFEVVAAHAFDRGREDASALEELAHELTHRIRRPLEAKEDRAARDEVHEVEHFVELEGEALQVFAIHRRDERVRQARRHLVHVGVALMLEVLDAFANDFVR